MPYQRGPDRTQTQLLPPSVEEYVAPDALVRVIDAFVEQLDLVQLGFERAVAKDTGRPGYYPGDLLRLYIYGYVNRIRSSRRLEAEASRNLEVIWLLRGLRPDFKTIADFRRLNISCFKGVLREFNLLCRKLNLFAAEIVAIDGSKFKASNNFRKSYTAEQLRELLTRIDEGIAKYLQALDQADAEAKGAGNHRGSSDSDSGGRGGGQRAREKRSREKRSREKRSREKRSREKRSREIQMFQDKLTHLAREKAECESLLEELNQSAAFAKRQDIARTDRDSRRLKRGNGAGTLVGYNVQVAVDGKHGLIVAEEVVTEANDLNQLSPMAQAALTALAGIGTEASAEARTEAEAGPGPKTLSLLADSGYCEADELAACETMSCEMLGETRAVEVFVPRRRTTQGQGAKNEQGETVAVYAKDQFEYDAERDVYHCPAQQELRRACERVRDGKLSYQYKTSACTGCPLKAQCTTSQYRSLTRRANEAAVERARARVKSHPAMMALRHALVERVFGTMRLDGQDQFLMRGLRNVRGEFSLSSLGYNLRRSVNIVGVPALLAALGAV